MSGPKAGASSFFADHHELRSLPLRIPNYGMVTESIPTLRRVWPLIGALSSVIPLLRSKMRTQGVPSSYATPSGGTDLGPGHRSAGKPGNLVVPHVGTRAGLRAALAVSPAGRRAGASGSGRCRDRRAIRSEARPSRQT